MDQICETDDVATRGTVPDDELSGMIDSNNNIINNMQQISSKLTMQSANNLQESQISSKLTMQSNNKLQEVDQDQNESLAHDIDQVDYEDYDNDSLIRAVQSSAIGDQTDVDELNSENIDIDSDEDDDYDYDESSSKNNSRIESVVVINDSESPKKLIADNHKNNKFPKCIECGKIFPSFKSLYGHLRCHPQRGYRGANPPPHIIRKNHSHHHHEHSAANWSVRARRGRKGLITDAAAASILLLLASGDNQPRKPIQATHQNTNSHMKRKNFEEEQVLEHMDSRGKKKMKNYIGRKYKCTTCNKTFSTHQALGGHRASHKRHYNHTQEEIDTMISIDNKLNEVDDDDNHEFDVALNINNVVVAGSSCSSHKCDICGVVFPTGQALGGHKRRHYIGAQIENRSASSSSLALSSESAGNKLYLLDLNEVPKVEEEE